MEKNNCNIIKDLLLLYVDNLASEESNQLINAHLTECEDCRNTVEIMKHDIKFSKEDTNTELDYLKKVKSKRKTLVITVIVICVLVFSAIICIGIKVFIIGFPVANIDIDSDLTDEFYSIGYGDADFNEETNELTIHGEITARDTKFSSIKVEENDETANILNVTIYGTPVLFGGEGYNRKFEHTIKIPDINNHFTVYLLGNTNPHDMIPIWSNEKSLFEKTEPYSEALKTYLIQHSLYPDGYYRLQYAFYQEINGENCFAFDHYKYQVDVGEEDYSVQYAISEDTKNIYRYDYNYDSHNGQYTQINA